jgi:hypothetical protein
VEDTAKAATAELSKAGDTDTVGFCSTAFPNPPSTPSTRWVLDSAASSHMTNNLDLFINIVNRSREVKLGDNSKIESYGKGTIELQGKLPTGTALSLNLRDVLYVPKFGQSNLLS